MNYTEKYHLPQWVKEDRIMMEDFNQMCADMEAGLGKTASDAAAATAKAAADAASATAAAAASAAKAQSTANTAVSKADAARAVADAAYSPSQPPYVIGSYIGHGENSMTLHVGFKPSFLIIGGGSVDFQLAAGPGSSCENHVEFTSDGFTVKKYFITAVSGTSEQLPYLLRYEKKYQYIAFR